MPHLPDSHHDHDLALVAALAAGDAQGRDHTRATELVTSCVECALVRDDLVVLASSLHALPAPRRTHDYRLTAEQAAALRPTGWRRLLGAFGGTGFRFATPVGTAMATLGIAGLLLSAVPSSLPAGTTGDGTNTRDQLQVLSQEASGPAASSGPAAIGPAPQGEVPVASEAAPSAAASASAAPAPSASVGPVSGRYETDQASHPADTTQAGAAAAASGGPAATSDIAGEGGTQLAAPPAASTTAPTVAPTTTTPDRTLVLVATLLVVAGLGLVGLRYTARRVA
jgi:hypothetical protein